MTALRIVLCLLLLIISLVREPVSPKRPLHVQSSDIAENGPGLDHKTVASARSDLLFQETHDTAAGAAPTCLPKPWQDYHDLVPGDTAHRLDDKRVMFRSDFMKKPSIIKLTSRLLIVMALLPCFAFADGKEAGTADDELFELEEIYRRP